MRDNNLPAMAAVCLATMAAQSAIVGSSLALPLAALAVLPIAVAAGARSRWRRRLFARAARSRRGTDIASTARSQTGWTTLVIAPLALVGLLLLSR